jgi:hypothetical protein
MQPQALQEWIKTVQSCPEALVQNTVSIQENALDRITEANKETLRIAGGSTGKSGIYCLSCQAAGNAAKGNRLD